MQRGGVVDLPITFAKSTCVFDCWACALILPQSSHDPRSSPSWRMINGSFARCRIFPLQYHALDIRKHDKGCFTWCLPQGLQQHGSPARNGCVLHSTKVKFISHGRLLEKSEYNWFRCRLPIITSAPCCMLGNGSILAPRKQRM